jgi:hypothetical protein
MTESLIHNDTVLEFAADECSHCSDAGDVNAHVVRTNLRAIVAFSSESRSVATALAAIEFIPSATSVVETDATELMCWCGHSLHYRDCPSNGTCHLSYDDNAGSCLRRYQGRCGLIK